MTGESDRDDSDGEPSVEELLERGGDLQGERDPLIAGMNERLPEGWNLPGWAGSVLGWGLFGVVLVALITGVPIMLNLSQGPADVGGTYENVSSIEGEVPDGYHSFEGTIAGATIDENGTVVMDVKNGHGETYAVTLVGTRVAGASNATVEPARYDLAATAENRSCVQAAGEEARSLLDEGEGQTAQVVVNASSVDGEDDRDVRGYVGVGERTVGMELIGHGVATGTGNHSFAEQYGKMESTAIDASIGVWSCPGYESLGHEETTETTEESAS